MPQAAIAFGVGFASVGLPAAFTAAGFSLSAALVGGGLAVFAYLLAPKPKKPSISDNITLTRRTSRPYRRTLYGQVRIGLDIIFIDTRGGNAEGVGTYLDIIGVLANHPCEEVEAIYLNSDIVITNAQGTVDKDGWQTKYRELVDRDILVSDEVEQQKIQNRYSGFVKFKSRLDGTSTPFSELHAHGKWRGTDRGTGTSLVWVELKYQRDVFVSGEPDIEFLVKGKKIYDPRTDTTAYSANAALVMADYLTSHAALSYGLFYEPSIISAANTSDEEITFRYSGRDITEKRYEIHGAITTQNHEQQVVDEMVRCCGGAVYYTHKGGYRIDVGTANVAETSINFDNLANAPVNIVPKVDFASRFNTVITRHRDIGHGFQWIDSGEITDPLYVVADGNRKLTRTIDFQFIRTIGQAVRVGQMILRRQRTEPTLSITIKDINVIYELRPFQCINVTYTPAGIINKKFRIMTWEPSPVSDSNGMVCEIVLKQENDEIYEYAEDLSNIGFRPSLLSNLELELPSLTGLSAQSTDEELRVLRDGTVTSRILVSWTATNSPYRDATEVEYTVRGKTLSIRTISNSVFIDNAIDGEDYRIVARHINNIGIGGTSQEIIHNVEGKSAPPSLPQLISMRQVGNNVEMTLSNFTDRDIAGIEIRFHRQLIENVNPVFPDLTQEGAWEAATSLNIFSLSNTLPQASQKVVFDFIEDGRYRIAYRVIDTSGNESPIAYADMIYIREDDFIDAVAYRPSWAGTLTNGVIAEGNIYPVGRKRADAVTQREWTEHGIGQTISDVHTIFRPAFIQFGSARNLNVRWFVKASVVVGDNNSVDATCNYLYRLVPNGQTTSITGVSYQAEIQFKDIQPTLSVAQVNRTIIEDFTMTFSRV